MSLETSRKILKISGILCLIGAALGILGGIVVISTGGMGAVLPEAQTDEAVQTGVNVLFGLGIATIISGIISVVEGIVSIRASKDNKYGKLAWIFAMISMLLALTRTGAEVRASGFSGSTLLTFIFTLIISGLVYTAALNVKKAYDQEQGL